MKSKSKWIVTGLLVAMVLSGTTVALSKTSLFTTSGTIEYNPSATPVWDDLDKDYHILEDESYVYYLDQDNFPDYILAKDIQEMELPARTNAAFTKQDAARLGEKLFDQVFAQAVQGQGRKKEVVVDDFDGGAYQVTIRLLEGEWDTGYCASLSYSAKGQLVVSTFIPGKKQEAARITQELAIELAKEALIKDCQELYGKEAVIHWDKARDLNCRHRAFKGEQYWEVESYVPTEHMGPWEGYELYSLIRIDAISGQCMGIATPLK